MIWLRVIVGAVAVYGGAYLLEPYLGLWIVPLCLIIIAGLVVLLRTALRDGVVYMADVWLTESFVFDERGNGVDSACYRLLAEALYVLAGTKERT